MAHLFFDLAARAPTSSAQTVELEYSPRDREDQSISESLRSESSPLQMENKPYQLRAGAASTPGFGNVETGRRLARMEARVFRGISAYGCARQ